MFFIKNSLTYFKYRKTKLISMLSQRLTIFNYNTTNHKRLQTYLTMISKIDRLTGTLTYQYDKKGLSYQNKPTTAL